MNKIIWNNEVFKKKTNTQDYIKKSKDLVITDEVKAKLIKDNEYEMIMMLKNYQPRKMSIVYWVRNDKLLFRFLTDHFSWNEYESDNFDLYVSFNDIYNEIKKEFPYLYEGAEFISYLESQRYWTYKHLSTFNI